MSQESHVLAPDPAVDLAVAEAMVEDLETYIINEDLYRTVITRTPGGEVRVQMTGGDLLARLHRLNAERARLTSTQVQRLDATSHSAETIIKSLKGRFHTRLQRELKARLDSLRWFLDEVSESPAAARANYPYEIRHRQRIQEILKRVGDELPDELRGQLQSLDARLRAVAIGGDFVWDPSLREAFPQNPYWYLYARV